MLITPTIDKLYALALTGMARALVDQLERADYAALSFEERLGLLVDREMQDRDNRRLARHLKAARLRSDAVIEDLDLRGPRGLDRTDRGGQDVPRLRARPRRHPPGSHRALPAGAA